MANTTLFFLNIIYIFYSAHARVKMEVKIQLRGMVLAHVNASVMALRDQLADLLAANVKTGKSGKYKTL